MTSLAQPIRRYDVRISGVSSTDARKALAAKDPIFALELGANLNTISGIYSPTPNKLIGTAQYPHPKVVSEDGYHTSPKSRYPSYMMKPNWHGEVVTKLRESEKAKGGTQKAAILGVYEELFSTLPEANSKVKKKLNALSLQLEARTQKREWKQPEATDKMYLASYKKIAQDPAYKTPYNQTPSELVRRETGVLARSAWQQSQQADESIPDNLRNLSQISKSLDIGKASMRLSSFTSPVVQQPTLLMTAPAATGPFSTMGKGTSAAATKTAGTPLGGTSVHSGFRPDLTGGSGRGLAATGFGSKERKGLVGLDVFEREIARQKHERECLVEAILFRLSRKYLLVDL